MKINDKIGIVCCSNGLQNESQNKINLLKNTLIQLGLEPVFSKYIYEKEMIFNDCGKYRAKALMDFYQNEEIKAVFDISGGDIANEVLSHLNFEIIKRSHKLFWGYSDLTTIINAIYAKTENKSVLYQIRNLISQDSKMQVNNFSNTFFQNKEDLYSFNYEFIQGDYMQGIVVGGNIRCLLKLAGTEYWPCMDNKILLLEARSGTVSKMITYLSQLKQMGVFEKINGIILGTFTEMENLSCVPAMTELVRAYVNDDLPIIKTNEIGHGYNSKAIIIGKMAEFVKY